jgi:hypothetical protein
MEIKEQAPLIQKKENYGITIILIVMAAVLVVLCLGCCLILFAYAVAFQIDKPDSLPQTKCPLPPESWRLSVSDTFDSDLAIKPGLFWPINVVDNIYVKEDWGFVDNSYRVLLTPRQGMIDYMSRKEPVVKDFYLTVDVKEVKGAFDDYYGVVFRQTHNNFYAFVISDT